MEVFWNHVLRYRGDVIVRTHRPGAGHRQRRYTMVKFHDETMVAYSLAGAKSENLNNTIAYFIQETVAPARLAGEVLLVQETLDQSLENRRAWVYNAGQRRVRRAPNVAFDNPGTNSDDLRTSDQFDMYNGSPQRYDWTLVGKKEMLVPYNSYKLNSNTLKYADILKKNHINPDVARYELHRVWVVDSKLKSGQSHLYSRRTLYVDEDSWQILAVDCYDSRGQLYRVQEGHVINLLRRAGAVDRARDGLRPDQRPLPRARPRQRRAAQPRFLAEAHAGRLPAGGAATPRRSVKLSQHYGERAG